MAWGEERGRDQLFYTRKECGKLGSSSNELRSRGTGDGSTTANKRSHNRKTDKLQENLLVILGVLALA